jgi:prepilin-type N-terminal cleavage/methylation domain-containing protein
MKISPSIVQKSKPQGMHFGFTLVEVVMSLVIVATVFSGVLIAYTGACKRAEWSGYALAAQGLAIQQMEQARAATWDPAAPTNQFLLLPLTSSSLTYAGSLYTYKGYTWTNLDLPVSGTNFVPATNFVTIRLVNGSVNGVQYQMIKVDTVWPFVWRSQTNFFTNSIGTLIAPDNRQI